MSIRVGVIGLGNMGRPIAKNLLRAGIPMAVFDLRRNAAEPLESAGALVADSPAHLARESDVVFLVVPDSTAAQAALFGRSGVAGGAAHGSVVVDMTTGDPTASPRFAQRLARRGVAYLDSPMTGGATGARAGQLLLMVGGDRPIYDRCVPLFQHISKRAIHVGPVGSGHVMKLIHNHVSHAVFAATCEGVALGERLGLSPEDMLEVFNAGNARSYTTEVRFPRFILPRTYNSGASFDIVRKDMALVQRLGRRARFRLPISGCVYRYWAHAVETGLGREDWSKIGLLLKDYLSRAR
jgi:3-hydroxyisobutyrate dehydrogenase-like beta-hydroxyacid dehydrogenase